MKCNYPDCNIESQENTTRCRLHTDTPHPTTTQAIEAAKAKLKAGKEDPERLGDNPSWYWIPPGSKTASLDGDFNRDELMALVLLLDYGADVDSAEPPSTGITVVDHTK